MQCCGESKPIKSQHRKKSNVMTVDSFECPLTGCSVVDGKLLPSESSPRIFTSDQCSIDDERWEVAAMIERAKRGNAEAMYTIGNWYDSGVKGLARNSSDAHWWWERACEHRPEDNAENNQNFDVQWINILEFPHQ